jgi:hypothetical protein
LAGGFEDCGSLDPVNGFDTLAEQEEQTFPTLDPNLAPQWEFNLGVGIGEARSTDHLIVKFILGYRFDFSLGLGWMKTVGVSYLP